MHLIYWETELLIQIVYNSNRQIKEFHKAIIESKFSKISLCIKEENKEFTILKWIELEELFKHGEMLLKY